MKLFLISCYFDGEGIIKELLLICCKISPEIHSKIEERLEFNQSMIILIMSTQRKKYSEEDAFN